MAKIHEIVEQVVAKETQQLQEQIKQAKREAEERIAKTRQSLEKELVQRKAQIDVQVDNQYQIEKNSLEIETRDRVLQNKQAILNQVFQNARQELDEITPEQFHAFLNDVLKQFAGEREEIVSLKLAERSERLFRPELLQKQFFGSLQVKVMDELIPNASGFILITESAQYNFLFDSLVEDARQKLIVNIAKYFRSE